MKERERNYQGRKKNAIYVSWHWQKLMVVMHMCLKDPLKKREKKRPLQKQYKKKYTTEQNKIQPPKQSDILSLRVRTKEHRNKNKTIINATFGTKLIIFILNLTSNALYNWLLHISYFHICLQISINAESSRTNAEVKVNSKWMPNMEHNVVSLTIDFQPLLQLNHWIFGTL